MLTRTKRTKMMKPLTANEGEAVVAQEEAVITEV